MEREHHYKMQIRWTGNKGSGTSHYTAYSRDHEISSEGKPVIQGSSDPAFRGEPSRYNPEDLLVASLSSCHMLWYLHLCAEAGILVTDYYDEASGIMVETSDGGGRFKEVILHPVVTVTESTMLEKAREIHQKAAKLCFIANSVNFPVKHKPVIVVT